MICTLKNSMRGDLYIHKGILKLSRPSSEGFSERFQVINPPIILNGISSRTVNDLKILHCWVLSYKDTYGTSDSRNLINWIGFPESTYQDDTLPNKRFILQGYELAFFDGTYGNNKHTFVITIDNS